MKIALISDIHGNDLLLKKVLEDIGVYGADTIICLGDTVALGVKPMETMELLKRLEASFVLGNHDEFLINPRVIGEYRTQPVIIDTVAWCREKLSDEDMTFLKSFKSDLTIPLDENMAMYCCHGSPRSSIENILSDTPGELLEEMIAGIDTPVIACGHTHVPMLRQHRGRMIVNPGSTGFAFKECNPGAPPQVIPYAQYAMLDVACGGVTISLRSLPLSKSDRKILYDSAEASDSPLREYLMHAYL